MRIPRPAAEDQKRDIEDIIMKSTAAPGDTFYIIAKKWFQDWENYVNSTVGNDGDSPGPIDNAPLVNEENVLRKDAQENRDYELIPEEAWSLLYQWYTGGPSLPRKAVKLNNRAHIFIEVRLTVINFSHKEFGVVTKAFSKGDTIGDVKKSICTRWSLDPTDIEVWDATGAEVEDMNKQLGELHISDGQKIQVTSTRMTIVDEASSSSSSSSSSSLHTSDSNGTEDITTTVHPMSDTSTYTSSSSSSSSSSYSYTPYTPSTYTSSYTSYYDTPKRYPPAAPGIVGLNNLGNTCFMNSSLQCLSNTVPLCEFFLSGAYERDVNEDNPLGTKGKLAEAFARLIKELWGGNSSAVAPREFKSRLEGFAPQFSGYQQHDSQELLAFLLDGLHEDLNRVKNKKYVESRDDDTISDEVRAKEAWEIHKNRNDSVVVDWFQASLKSTLVCPDCSRVSVTFDPFMYLSLPLPMKLDRSVPLTLVKLDVTLPQTKYLVKVPKHGTIGTLKAKLGEMAGVSPDCLVFTDVFNSKFFKKFNDLESIDAFDEERDVLFAYEVEPQPENEPNLLRCAVYNRRDEPRNPHYPSMQPTTQLFGIPFFVSVPSGATYQTLYDLVYNAASRWFKVKKQEEEEEEEEEQPDSVESESAVKSEQAEDDNNENAILSADDGKERYFTICSVDSHGYHETTLYDNDSPLDLENRSTIAVHWKTQYLHYFEDVKTAIHSSMTTVDPTDPDGITLDKCLSLYTTTEMLGPDDLWYCNRCKDHKQATKKFDLWSTPRILVVHLKRFSYRNKYFREKLETLVACPLRGLDLSNHIIGPKTPPPIYDLYAVSNHYGSLGGGHYTAYALNKSTNKWYKFDDSYASEIDEAQVISSSAYVLFYRRRDTIDISAIPQDILNVPSNGENGGDQEEDVSASDEEDQPLGRRPSSHMDLD